MSHFSLPPADRPRWLSANEDRAWAEKFFLLYSPAWMLLMGIMMPTGWASSASDSVLLLHSLLVALPLFVVPLILRKGKNPPGGWRNSYWFKANLYIAVFGIFGNYFGSEYFFDVLGMVYAFPNVTTTADSALLGSGEQVVPLVMYLYTHAYFMTYHTTAIIALRRLMTSALPKKGLLFLPFVFVIGYLWSWAETAAMANPMIATNFRYENMQAMLAYGSMLYGTYFLASFPLFYFLDENANARWSTAITAMAACTASMLTFYMLDLATHAIGKIF